MATGEGRLGRLGARLLCAVLSASLASGCTTMRPVPPTAGGFQESIHPGDRVRVVMRDGSEVELRVTAVTAETLAGELTRAPVLSSRHVTLRLADVARIERSGVSAGKTAALGGAVVVGLAVAGLLFLLAVLSTIPAERDPPAHGAVPEPRRR